MMEACWVSVWFDKSPLILNSVCAQWATNYIYKQECADRKSERMKKKIWKIKLTLETLTNLMDSSHFADWRTSSLNNCQDFFHSCSFFTSLQQAQHGFNIFLTLQLQKNINFQSQNRKIVFNRLKTKITCEWNQRHCRLNFSI